MDRFSKGGRFIPFAKLPSAPETAEALVQRIIGVHGLPPKPLSAGIVGPVEGPGGPECRGARDIVLRSAVGGGPGHPCKMGSVFGCPQRTCLFEWNPGSWRQGLLGRSRSAAVLSQRVHLMLHVSRLSPVLVFPLQPPGPPPSVPRVIDGLQAYMVHRLINSRRPGQGIQFLEGTVR